MDKKPTENTSSNNAQISTPPEPQPAKRKLTLDIEEVSELERKISPGGDPIEGDC